MLQIRIDRPSPAMETRPPLPAPERTALFLDLDGTLAAIEPTPEAVGPSPRRTALLRELLGRLDGRVAVLSGRPIADIDRILEGAVTAVAGVHGLERRMPDGRLERVPAHPALGRVEETLASFARGQRGLLVESKPQSVALHYRGHPPAGDACLDIAHRLAAVHELGVQEGHMVVELRTPGPDKGDSVRAFMADPAFRDAVPVAVGDDLTDEHAFEAVLDHKGWGVLVGAPRPTSALYRLGDPDAVQDWLEEYLR
jgi:trehalose 6-phosphate phosphatase